VALQAEAPQRRLAEAWALLALACLAGCADIPARLNPIAAIREATGGRPAQDLPPVPGADGAYPNLGTIPPRPAPPSAAQRRQVMAALEAERAAAGAPALPGAPAAPPPLPRFDNLPDDALDPIPPPPGATGTVAPDPPVRLGFAPGAAQPAPADAARLRELAAAASGRRLAVIGYGDAVATDADAQAAGLALGLSRAQAVAQVLRAAGVPPGRIALEAGPAGRAAEARVLD
jgi:outer membrane protein OmpA-like peptidoglycan-associated protein